jgi:hypothetical protein
LKKIAFLSLSLLLLLILIPSCAATQTPPATPLVSPPVIRSFSSNPATINSGGTSTLWWNVTGATTTSIDQGLGPVDAVGSTVVSPAKTTVYTISATNSTGTITKSATITIGSAPPPAAPVAFAVTSVIASTSPSNFTGACPKTFTFNATITANGPGTVNYIWESFDGKNSENSDTQSVIFTEAGTKTTTLQWDLLRSAVGLHRVHIMTPNDTMSIPVYYDLNCGSGSLVTGIMVGVDQYPFTGPCPKTINFWGTIVARGPGTVTYRWERSDGSAATTPDTITFTAAGSQTITNQWTRGEGYGWQRLHVLTPDEGLSSQIDFSLTCDK